MARAWGGRRVPGPAAAAAAALLVAAAAVAWFGDLAARSAAGGARSAAIRVVEDRARGEAAAAGTRLAAAMEAVRAGDIAAAPFSLQAASVPWSPPAPGADTIPDGVFEEAERREREDRDPAGALRAYESAMGRLTVGPAMAEALRRCVRLHAAAGDEAAARDALNRLQGLAGAPDRTVLLATFEVLRGPAATEAERVPRGLERSRLQRSIEEGAFPGVPPAERALLHRRLDGDPARILALRAAAALSESPDPAGALRLDDHLAWSLPPQGANLRVALAPLPALLAALLPGVREGVIEESAAGVTVLPPPFPAVSLAPAAAALAAADRAGADAASGRRLPAFAVALVLAAAAGLAVVNARARARLERRRDDFVCAVTHELKTPLANILLYAETLKEHGASDPARVPAFAGTVAGEALKLQARVQDVLDVASGAREVADGEAVLDPAEEAAAAAEDALPAARAAGMTVEVAPRLGGPLARGHAPVVRRALAAVLDNGVKFAGRGALRVHVEYGDGEVRIVVDDDGPGIPAADRERVFEPFVRLEEGRARSRDGSGLGLALARRCMEALGGTARAEEAPGGGARVVLVLREAEGAHDPAR